MKNVKHKPPNKFETSFRLKKYFNGLIAIIKFLKNKYSFKNSGFNKIPTIGIIKPRENISKIKLKKINTNKNIIFL